VSRVGRREVRLLLGAVALFVAYTITAKLGLKFDALNGVATTVWPPTGIALAALLRLGPRVWPAVTLGAFLVNMQAGAPLVTATIIAIGNTLEAVVGAAALRRLEFRASMIRLRDVSALVATAILSTTLSATFGTFAVRLGEGPPQAGYAEFWSVWWLGDVIGALLVAPALLTFSADRSVTRQPSRWLEALVAGGLLVFTALLAFGGWNLPAVSEIARGTYVVWPLLIWVALRFGPRGSTAALLLLALVAIGCTVLGRGPFTRQTPHESLRILQSYVAITAVTILTLAAALSERRQAVLARDDFLSIASHELRTPLTALKLRLDTTSRLLEGKDQASVLSGRLVQAVAMSRRQVERLERLVADLLDVSRLRADRLSLHVEPVCVAELVRETVGRFADELQRAGCALELEIPERLEVRCDRSRIEQVLTNLVANAIKYAPEKPVHVSLQVGGERVRLAVRDHGEGIDSRDQRRIFEPYQRLASARHVGGLGLGLYIGRQIAEAHGGRLLVDNEPGAGAVFTLELPFAPPARSPAFRTRS
jgi:signal transduction histidine kinase